MIDKLRHKFLTFNSILHAYDYPDASDGWTKVETPIINTGDICFDPYVYKFEKKYYMYVSNRTQNSIDLFVSKEAFRWEKLGTCIYGSKCTAWDEVINRACVVMHNDEFLMFFTGQHKGCSCIGVASSTDGKVFHKRQSTPILCPEFSYEKKSVMNPCVLWNSEKKIFQMWYSAGETIEPDVICYAESKNGIEWNKLEFPVFSAGEDDYDSAKVGGCDVHYIDGKYIMYYIGYRDINTGRICSASSEDGITWTRDIYNPIISPTKHSWDAHSVYKPCVVYEENRLLLWYNGRKNYQETIGMAYKKIRD